MTRWRIDFSVREAGVPEDEARGIKFGDEVELSKVHDFFDRCRDAVAVLLGARPGSPADAFTARMDVDHKALVKAMKADERKKMEAMWCSGPPSPDQAPPERDSLNDVLFAYGGSPRD